MSILKRQVNSSSDFSSFFSAITRNSSCIFYFRQKDPMKVPILTLSSVVMKICQIPHVIFQTTSHFFFKFCMTPQCHELQLLCTFLGQTLYTLHKKDQSKCKFFRLLSARIKITKFLSFLKQKIVFSSNFAQLFGIMRHNSSVLF